MESLRIGADCFASDLNPVAVILNKVVLEYMPKFGSRLTVEVQKWGDWIAREARVQLADLYRSDVDGATPIAYIWARTIRCEGPGCGAEVPMLRSKWLAKKGASKTGFNLVVDKSQKTISLSIDGKAGQDWDLGTIKNGAVSCPVCGYTTDNKRVRAQLTETSGGAKTARLLVVVVDSPSSSGRTYRLPAAHDLEALASANQRYQNLVNETLDSGLPLLPDELIERNRPSPNARGLSAVTRMGVARFSDLFSQRQLTSLSTILKLVNDVRENRLKDEAPDLAAAIITCLAISLSKLTHLMTSLGRWEPNVQTLQEVFSRPALPICWDFAEGNPIGQSRGSWQVCLESTIKVLENWSDSWPEGHVAQLSAIKHSLPDHSAAAFVTDPPYYDAIPYADISDFFYVWLRRTLQAVHPSLFETQLTPKDEEIIWNPSRIFSRTGRPKDEAFYTSLMKEALEEGRRLTAPGGIGVVVFAHKSTAGWEAVLQALIDAGWTTTASWPIDTELGTRMNAMGTASLSSSVHLVCRPRESFGRDAFGDEIGEWRDVLAELPLRIHEWMPRLQAEGVVGADAIFACLGPALEIFSRYARVEKPNGDQVPLKEYLEYVWAAVSREALLMIFEGADTTGFEEDARLTAMWLWTLSPGLSEGDSTSAEELDDVVEDADEKPTKPGKLTGFMLEYDAARKIAQGLGAHLELLVNLVEVKGETARLLPVAERTKALFGKEGTESPAAKRKKSAQLSLPGLLDELEQEDSGWTLQSAAKPGSTTLDRLHQAMILFAAGRGEALRRFLVDDGVGKDQKFWSLAQSLCALYPSGTDERRWSEGVLARKKGLGL
jgi:adenine-specific DNA methylase